MEEKKQQSQVIDLREVVKKIWSKKKLFYKTLPITFVVSCIFILGVPRTYTSEITLAPEMESSGMGGTLGTLASSFGIDMGNMQTSDAITPYLYPDLMEDNGFVTKMFRIRVKDLEGEIDTDYYTYLKKYQKKTIWKYPIVWIKKLLPKKETIKGSSNGFNPYHLSNTDDEVAEAVRNNIEISINKKNGIITIATKAQDRLICKTLADSVKQQLQEFITDYRTNKARTDYEYYKKLAAEAKSDYEKTRRKYGATSDADMDVTLKSVELMITDLENDMQLKYNAYMTLNSQMLAAKAKVQERTPAFTIMKGAAVPIKASSPKRMLFVLGMLFLAFVGTIFYILKDDIFAPFIKQS
ncbi:MAG: chain-length determining protein [Prevotella sp.]|nr:chain-length determining protein [Prevotella sp.]